MSSTTQQESETVVTETIGNRLRRERLGKHITLEEVAEATRVNIKNLQAIEEDDKSKLPSRVFVQGFIRLYALHLGIDPQEALDQYAREQDDTLDSRSKINVKKVLTSESMAESPSILTSKQILFVILIILLGVLIYLGRQDYNLTIPGTETFTEQSSEAPSPPSVSPATQEAMTDQPTDSSEQQPSDVEPEEEAASSIESEDAVSVTESAPAQALQEHVLKAHFVEKTWLWIQVDDRQPKEYLFQPGQRYTWKGFHKFDINLGNAGGVKLVLNDKEIPQIGISGQVVRLKMPDATQTLLQEGDGP